ncbi:outer membrane protein [Mesorhizobium sp. CAU 1732]|uniref:outer membrane protein n=1 Tax=Mesorhizobium sp. CAU 1732 TaxID=3140358 RepID=UPI003260201B
MNKRFALSAVAGLSIAAAAAFPAFAADVVYEEPPMPAAPMEVAPVASWAGPYAGIQLGYGFNGEVDGAGNTIDTDGFMGGAFGGFNMQNGQFVYGVEADVNYSDVDGGNAGIAARSRIDGSLRGRAGVAINDDVLIYGTAGVAAERLRVSAPDVVGSPSDTNMMIGYTVGAGTDVKLTEQVFARGEYRYTDFGNQEFELPGVGTADFDSSNHRVMLGVGIKF